MIEFFNFFQSERRDGMVERHDLDQFLAKRAIEKGNGFGAGHAEMING